jgi:DNA-binding winged helix-turn-helix (wHTH) protein
MLRWKQEAFHLEERIEQALQKCSAKALIKSVGEGKYAATELGRITALKGIKLSTCSSLVDWMQQADPRNLTELEILNALSLTEDAQQVYIPLPYREQRAKNYRAWLRKEIFNQQEEGKAVFKGVLGPMQTAEAEEARAIKKALLLSEWITPKATAEIENTYELHSGAIRRIAEEFSWLAEAAAAIAKAIGWPEQAVKKLSEVSERLIYGVTVQGLSLSKIRLRGLGRTYIARLVKEGYDSPEALAQLSLETLENLLPQQLAHQLYFHLHPGQSEIPQRQEPSQLQGCIVGEAPVSYQATVSSDSPAMLIDLAQQAVSYKGIHVPLSFYPFRFLVALARTPGKVIPKTELYDAVYGNADGHTDDDRPYERQLSDHKRRILAQIRKAAGQQEDSGVTKEEIGKLIAVKRRVGYKLNLSTGEVSIRE